MNRAERNIAFVERYCKVPDGKFVGEPLKFADFQKEFFHGIFGNRKIRRAIWSMARKNAKTVTIACLLLVFLVGPEAKENSQIVSGAMSREQASLVFDACCKIIRQSPELMSVIKIRPSSKELIGLPMNVHYKALSAEGKTAHGLSPLVIIIDELGQVVGPRSEFYEALTTSQGAHENPLEIIISTQAATDADLLSVLIDDAKDDENTYCVVHEAPAGCDLLDKKAWEAANPALGLFRSLEDVENQAQAASRMPSAEASFRNLILNQRVSTVSPFVSRSVWQGCQGEMPKPSSSHLTFGGLDLSGKTDLTALVLTQDINGVKPLWAWFWTPEKNLIERSRKDRAPYDQWVQEGWIRTTSGATVDYEYVARDMLEILEEFEVCSLAFDRWRIDLLMKEFADLGHEPPLVPFGQGYKDMSPALDHLEADLLNERIVHDGNPVLTMCMANAVITQDPAGNRKLDKHKATGRIDGAVAAAMAIGQAAKSEDTRMPVSPWEDENFTMGA